MNFKPTIWKTVLSIIVFVLVNGFYFGPTAYIGPQDVRSFDNFFLWWVILESLIPSLAIYIIWSLFQKK